MNWETKINRLFTYSERCIHHKYLCIIISFSSWVLVNEEPSIMNSLQDFSLKYLYITT